MAHTTTQSESAATAAHDQTPDEYQPLLFKSIRINQLSSEGTNWLTHVLHALDSKDVSAYAAFMADNITATFNNGEFSMQGIQAVKEGLGKFWQSFGTIRHEELNVYGTDENFVHEALNHYVALDGRAVTVRAVAWIDRDRAGKIVSLRIYNDQSPLWK